MSAEENVILTCPICRKDLHGFEPMRGHLIEEHELSTRQASFLANKMVDWKRGNLDPTLFPPEGG